MLSSAIPHAEVLIKFFNHNSPPGQSSSTILATIAENIEDAFERWFYTANSTRLNLYDNDLFLFTTAVDPRYCLDFFPANLKQEVVRLLKSKVKKNSCCDTGRSGQVPLEPLNKPKAQLP